MLLQPENIFVKTKTLNIPEYNQPVVLHYLTGQHLLLLEALKNPACSKDFEMTVTSLSDLFIQLSCTPEEILSFVEGGTLGELQEKVRKLSVSWITIQARYQDVVVELLTVPESVVVKKNMEQ